VIIKIPAVVTRFRGRHEAGRNGRWRISDAPERFIAGQLRAIVGAAAEG
jgi:transcriptional regulator